MIDKPTALLIIAAMNFSWWFGYAVGFYWGKIVGWRMYDDWIG